MKLTTFVTDIFGVSGRALLDAIVNGEVLDEALNGRLRNHHRKMLNRHLEHIRYLENEIQDLEDEIEQLVQPLQEEIERLDTIPGINPDAAASILAEIGAKRKGTLYNHDRCR